MKSLFQQATEWRQANGYQNKGGVIVFWNGTVQGWVNELRNPESWQPGCIAVDECGKQWIATGGNDYDGAQSWTSQFNFIYHAAKKSFQSTAATRYLRRIIKSRPDYDYRQSASDLSWTLLELMNKQLKHCTAVIGTPDYQTANARLDKVIRVHGKAVKRHTKLTDRALAFQDHQMRWFTA